MGSPTSSVDAIRDTAISVLFGVAAVWLWPALIGLGAALLQIPLLSTLIEKLGGNVTFWVPFYLFLSDIPLAALCALVIVGPLVWLVRARPFRVWCLFGGAFLVGLAIHSPELLFFASYSNWPWRLLYWSGPCMFLLCAFALLSLGHALWTQNATV